MIANKNNQRQKMRPQVKERIDRQIKGEKLYGDAYNAWGEAINFTRSSSNRKRIIPEPLKHYAERYRTGQGLNWNECEVEYLLQKSDPDSVKRFDELVDEINADRERINNEKDVKTVKAILKKVYGLHGHFRDRKI